VEADGGDVNVQRMRKLLRSRRGENTDRDRDRRRRAKGGDESKELVQFMRKADDLEEDMCDMDEGEFESAISRLSKKLGNASASDKKAMRRKIEDLEEAFGGKRRGGGGGGGGARKQLAVSSAFDDDEDDDVDISMVPEAHRQKLREDPSLAGDFDKKYGRGASAKILRGGGSRKAASPPVDQFDLMNMSSPTHTPAAKVDISHVPAEHAIKLRQNPSLAGDFDKRYGPGTADAILAPAPQAQAALTMGSSEESITLNGLVVKPEHVDMLLNNPSLGDKFDQHYGAGAAIQLLKMKGISQPAIEDDLFAW